MRCGFIVSGIVMACCGLAAGQALFQKPVKVLGDPNFIATASLPLAYDTLGPNWVEGRELNNPGGIAVDNSVSPPIIYIADSGNNRVLGYRYATQLVAGSQADIVIGQVDMFSNQAQNPASGGRSTGLNNPTGLAVDSVGNLYIADTGNNRILRFTKPFGGGSTQFPSLVIGQKLLSTSTANLNGTGASTLSINGGGRTGIAFDQSGNLWVADSGNNRALRFPAAALGNTNFPAADTVLGQADFVSSQGPASAQSSRITLTGLAGPNGLSIDASGNLYVTDQLYRVVFYKSPLTTNETASGVLGVDPNAINAASATQTSLNSPIGVLGLVTGPIVADTGNNRLMLYGPSASWTSIQVSPQATGVAGQSSFTVNSANQGNADASAASFNGPVDLAIGGNEVYVVDSVNNRVLVFPFSISGIGATASRVIGQLDFPYTGVNLVDGKGFSFPGSYPAEAVLDTSVASAHPHLYIADTLNNRVLGFRDFTSLQNGQPADIVIGQPDFNRTVVNYPSGQASTPNSSGLDLPTSLALDSAGNLYVTDTGNSRILRFPAPFASGQTSLETADLVLGQRDFTSVVTDATDITLNSPVGIALTSGAANVSGSKSGFLAVADSGQNRVLLFPTPFVSGMNATVVIGQSNFTNSTASGGAAGLNSPRGVAVDPQDHIMVADTGNARVQIFNTAASLGNFPQPVVSLTGVFSSPLSVAAGPAGDFWVADNAANRLVHFPSVANLALTNDAADATLQALAPHSAFVDSFNNLLVTDGIDRTLYFAPQINLTNAASYSTRPLAAGAIAALFPSVTTNALAAGTGTASAGKFPLLTSLADTEVTVNGVAVPLLYVSPAQDNIILPQGLATSGTADLQAIRASTGQIYGGAEISLAAASPGLFTQAALGSGQVLAVNFQDSTINGTPNPVLRGQYVILYGTGVGPVPGAPADGMAASGQAASDLPTVLIAASTANGSSGGFIPATVTYSGLAPGFAGLWQINVQIPNNAQSGSAVVLKLFEQDIPNLDQSSALTTTLAVR